jgi:hypothetical protein
MRRHLLEVRFRSAYLDRFPYVGSMDDQGPKSVINCANAPGSLGLEDLWIDRRWVVLELASPHVSPVTSRQVS